MAEKSFKTIDEQIKLLESRGLAVTDYDTAYNFLLHNNYYRVSGYSLTLRNHDIFSENTTFQNIIDIYEFDCELRHMLLKYLERIEVSVKSVYAYEFARIYGSTGYLNPSNFVDSDSLSKIMDIISKQKERQVSHEAYLQHFIYDLHEDIPIWALVDLFTVSNISHLYKISSSDVRMSVAKSLLNIKNTEVLDGFLRHISILRNLCAHGGRIFNRLFAQKPNLRKSEQTLLIKLPNGNRDNSHLFSYILVMRRLLNRQNFDAMKSEIGLLSEKYPFVNLRYYGFREDWKFIL